MVTVMVVVVMVVVGGREGMKAKQRLPVHAAQSCLVCLPITTDG